MRAQRFYAVRGEARTILGEWLPGVRYLEVKMYVKVASIPGLLPPYGILSRTNIITRVTFEPCAVVRRQKAWKIFIT